MSEKIPECPKCGKPLQFVEIECNAVFQLEENKSKMIGFNYSPTEKRSWCCECGTELSKDFIEEHKVFFRNIR